eukprot:1045742-Pyramimonas_sp.AAC.1
MYGMILGFGASRQVRKDGFYCPSSFVRDDMQNPGAKLPGYQLQRPKEQVDIVIDMQAAMQAGCEFWLGVHSAIICPQTVPRSAALAVRTGGGQ